MSHAWTIVDFAVAFENWESDYRANPTHYISNEEAASIGVSEISADRASYFLALLEKQKSKPCNTNC